MLPRVILHNATSIDGRTDWFKPDIELFYELTSGWNEDATLTGSETLLKAYQDESPQDGEGEKDEADKKEKDDTRPLLVVVDSRGRIRNWHRLKQEPYWRDAVALCSNSTPKDYLDFLKDNGVEYLVYGDDHVDLRQALEELNNRYGVQLIRVDSGGTLNGALLRAGLVDEVSVLVHPFLVGGATCQSMFKAPELMSEQGVITLKVTDIKKLKDDIMWLMYEVVKEQ